MKVQYKTWHLFYATGAYCKCVVKDLYTVCFHETSWWFLLISLSLLILTLPPMDSGKMPLYRTACSQVQSYQGLHRTAMFEQPNPQPSFFPNFNSCRCCHFPPTTTASVMFCTQTQRGPAQQETFVRPSKASRTCLMIKHCFDSSLWRVLQYYNTWTVPEIWAHMRSHRHAHMGIHTKWNRGKTDSESEYSPFCYNLQINPKGKGQGSRPIGITESVDLFKWVKDTLR